jgi:hypothetical protein
MIRWLAALLALSLAGCGADPVAAEPTLDGQPPIVIAHRGASGERPEHTLASYRGTRTRFRRRPMSPIIPNSRTARRRRRSTASR